MILFLCINLYPSTMTLKWSSSKRADRAVARAVPLPVPVRTRDVPRAADGCRTCRPLRPKVRRT